MAFFVQNQLFRFSYLHFFLWLTFFISFASFVVFKSYHTFGILEFPGFWDMKIQFINLAVPIIFVAYSLAQEKQQIVLALFWLFQLLFFGIVGLLSTIDPFPHYLYITAGQSSLKSAASYSLMAEIVCGAAQLVANARFKDHVIQTSSITPFQISRLVRRLKLALVWYAALLPFILQKLGGMSFLFKSSRFEPVSSLPVYLEAILVSALYAPPLVCLLLQLYFRNFFGFQSKLTILLILWIVILANPLTNARQTTLFLVLPIVFIYLQKSRTITNLFFSTLLFILVFLGDIVDRYTGKFQSPKFAILSRDGNFDAFAQLANGLTQIQNGAFPLFRQILASIFFFLPRSVWENKPYDTGVELGRLLSLKFQNLSAPWILEVYVNARLPGLILVSFCFIYYLAKSSFELDLSLRSWLISSVLFGSLFIVLRGSLLQATGRLTFTICFILLLTRNISGSRDDSKL